MDYYNFYFKMLIFGGMTFSDVRAIDAWIWQYVRMQPFLYNGLLNHNKLILKLSELQSCGLELWVGYNYRKNT